MTDSKPVDLPNSAAIISFSRVSGQAELYGMPFNVPGYIRLRVSPVVEERSLSRTWRYATQQPHIEVDLSYTQFAEAITTMNGAENVPCTIHRKDGHRMEEYHLPPPEQQEFKDEIDDHLADGLAQIQSAIAALDEMKAPKKAKDAVLAKLRRGIQQLTVNTEFVEESFTRRMLAVETSMKTELVAYADNLNIQLAQKLLSNEIESPASDRQIQSPIQPSLLEE